MVRKKRVTSGSVTVSGPPSASCCFENRRHRAGRAQHIAETHGNGARGAAAVERLAIDFAEPLGRAHHAGRINRLVGRDEDQIGPNGVRGFGDVLQAADIGEHAFARERLDHRHLLQRGGVEDDFRPLFREPAAHRCTRRGCRRARARASRQFEADLVEIVLGAIEQRQARRRKRRDAAREFAADRTAAARDQHALAGDHGADAREIDLAKRAADQIVEPQTAQRCRRSST